jgi:2-polyprenyl-3-methyl-5-hydroxy-6-metoxy-1,4-benzoquinol methylase
MKTPSTTAKARTPGRGHVLQPEWDGTDSIRERFDAVRPLLQAQSVLDVGCASRYGRPDWLHGLLAADTPDLVGIDMNEKLVSDLQAAGYDVRLADARDFDLQRQFDVVFAGELIEHLDDVRGFLTSVARHLKPGGRLVLTTPNAFYVGNFIYRLGGQARVHPQHTAWYCDSTLTRVLSMNGFAKVDLHYIGHASPTPARRLASATFRGVLPDRLALDTMVAVAVADAPDAAEDIDRPRAT